MPNLIGYARVSTDDQTVALQTDALESASCARIFTETASGKNTKRPELEAALDYLNEGDTLVVWRLDRLGRNVVDLITLVEELKERGIEFRSLTEHIDTSSPGGRLIFTVFAGLAQMERELLSERTKAGLNAARKRGKVPGRPPALTNEQIDHAVEMHANGTSYAEISRVLGVSRDTVTRAVQNHSAA
jgi:DNA invertase Pin-like site-specific DNA recombinase